MQEQQTETGVPREDDIFLHSLEQSSSSLPLVPSGGTYKLRRNHIQRVILAVLVLCLSIVVVCAVLTGILFKYSANPSLARDSFLTVSSEPHILHFSQTLDPRIVSALEHSSSSSSVVESLNKGSATFKVHSHNDYWRPVPLFDALSLGVTSVEADLWSFPNSEANSTLYVGHKRSSLTSYRTLDTLYLGPIESMLDEVNHDKPQGLFYDEPSTSLNLIIDIKNNPDHTLKLLQERLYPLWTKGYVTHFNLTSSQWVHAPLSVMLSGLMPSNSTDTSRADFDDVRVLFLDAPLYDLANAAYAATTGISYMASAPLRRLVNGSISRAEPYLSTEQQVDVTRYISRAHELGLQTRVWGTPAAPHQLCEGVWRQLWKLGSDWINADDLKAAVSL